MKNYKNILIDFDGTIVNSSEGVIKSLKYSLAKMGIENYDESVLKTFIGPPLVFSFKDKFGLDKEDTQKAIAFYRERYQVKGLYECEVYEGLVNCLLELKKSGKKLFVATSKPYVFAKKILDHVDLTKYFDGIFGATLDGSITEKEEVIEYAFSQHPELKKDETIMVGDTKYDIIGANIIGLDSMGVLYGFGGIQEMQEHGATYIVNTTNDIYKTLLG